MLTCAQHWSLCTKRCANFEFVIAKATIYLVAEVRQSGLMAALLLYPYYFWANVTVRKPLQKTTGLWLQVAVASEVK